MDSIELKILSLYKVLGSFDVWLLYVYVFLFVNDLYIIIGVFFIVYFDFLNNINCMNIFEL